MRVVLLGLVAALAPNFWASWGDGKGEHTGYQLTQQRYGETRSGTGTRITPPPAPRRGPKPPTATPRRASNKSSRCSVTLLWHAMRTGPLG